MRLLLDECVPKRVKDNLAGHDVSHVVEMGVVKRNVELLTLMVAERFDALLTVDQHLEFQQNVRASGIERETSGTQSSARRIGIR